jgi:hypothetical protein
MTLMPRRIASVGLLVVAAAAAIGCGQSRAPRDPSIKHVLAARVRRCSAGSTYALGSGRIGYAAVARGRVRAFRRPDRGLLARFGRLNVNGVPTVFGILGAVVRADCSPTWYHVQLPLRPNGVTGYVRANAVDVGPVRTRIDVDLSARRLEFFRQGKLVLRTAVAIGTSATPTPIGRFYVNQRLIPSDPTGPFGPAALGISAFSNVLTGWTQGGPVAIHGTDEPWSIGHAASNGCIRVRNDIVRRLFRWTLAGTPVVVRP